MITISDRPSAKSIAKGQISDSELRFGIGNRTERLKEGAGCQLF